MSSIPPILPLEKGPQISPDIASSAQGVARAGLSISLDREAAPRLEEWVGRDNFLAVLHTLWLDPMCHIVSLIGFGGEGKSSLARHWIEELLGAKEELPQPDGVFWWSFYEERNSDEFFEKSISYFSQGDFDIKNLPSDRRPQFLAALLMERRYLLVLDGLEVMQYQGGEDHGLLKSVGLSEFLIYLAACGSNNSLCLITSRASVTDIMPYITHGQLDVERLATEEGRELLRNLNVKGTDAELDQCVEDWSGHALTLALIGTYLQKPEFGGHIKEIENLPDLTDRDAFAEYQNNRLYRLLNGYDRFLDGTEKDFLQIFSVFRLPVPESALLSDVFNANEALARKLVNYRILRYNSERKEYTIHPLISAYYQTELKSHPEKWQATHREIARYYISLHRSESKNLTPLERLKPWIEAIHHFCQAEDFDSAFRVLEKNNFYKGPKNKPESILIFELGAYETALSLLQEFFVNGNISREPLTSNAPKKRFILREVSSCLTNLGRMSEVPAIMKLHNELATKSKAQHDLTEGYCSLARLSVYLGKLVDSVSYANLAIRAVKKVENNKYRQNAQAYKALAFSLMNGEEVETAYQEIAPSSTGEGVDDLDFKLIRDYGFYYVDFLRRNRGDLQAAQSVAEQCIREAGKSENISRSHRAAGEVYEALEDWDRALEHFNQAIDLARNITHWPASITALSARGRFLVRRHCDLEAGRNDLEEALEYSQNGGYRVYEADTRVGLARLHLAEGKPKDARGEAAQAKMMSKEMKYFWGEKDAEEVLTDLL